MLGVEAGQKDRGWGGTRETCNRNNSPLFVGGLQNNKNSTRQWTVELNAVATGTTTGRGSGEGGRRGLDAKNVDTVEQSSSSSSFDGGGQT